MNSTEKPIIFFDLETTGINISKDRIVQLSAIRIFPNGETRELNLMINPTIPIPAEVTEIHSITNEMVKDKPTFSDQARRLQEWFSGCDLAGFNHVNFDVPLLAEEFGRCGISFPDESTLFVDIKTIFHKKEERTLSAALKFYCNETPDNAHNALEDVKSTIKVWNAMKEKYSDLPETTSELHNYCFDGKPMVDFAGKLTLNDKGEIVYNFGKHAGKKVLDEPSYAMWMLGNDFPTNTKNILIKLLK